MKRPSPESEWTVHAKGFQYRSEGFSCEVNSAGVLNSLSFQGKKLIRSVRIFARLRLEKSKDSIRIFQNTSKALLLKTKRENDSVFLVCEGILNTRELRGIANFKEKITFRSREIVFDYEVRTLKDVKMKHWRPFLSLLNANVKNFIGQALEVFDRSGGTGIYEIPEKYSKEKEYWPKLLNKVNFINGMERFSIRLTDPQKAVLKISDGRSWNGSDFEITVLPVLPKGRGKFVEYSAGTLFKWSFKLSFEE
jgi:hypothetical protein